MPSFCSVFNCAMRAERDRVSFFRFPAILKNRGEHITSISTLRRKKWVMCLKRGELSETHLKYGRVCAKHFISGKPADLLDVDNPDWVPCQNLGYEVGTNLKGKAAQERHSRFRKRLRMNESSTDISQFRIATVPTFIAAVEVLTGTESSSAESSSEGTNSASVDNITSVQKTVVATVQCDKCDRVTEPVYREERLCKSHAPERRACSNSTKGCTYSDIKTKCDRHEWFYCQYSAECGICSEIITNTRLDAHYSQAHGDITLRAGRGCTVRPTRACEYLIITWDLGNVVCQYYLKLVRTYFVLRVHSTLTSEQLDKYRCTVELSHPGTGDTLTCIPRAWYDKWLDWQVRLTRAEFSPYFQDDEVHVKINITKIDDPTEFIL